MEFFSKLLTPRHWNVW